MTNAPFFFSGTKEVLKTRHLSQEWPEHTDELVSLTQVQVMAEFILQSSDLKGKSL